MTSAGFDNATSALGRPSDHAGWLQDLLPPRLRDALESMTNSEIVDVEEDVCREVPRVVGETGPEACDPVVVSKVLAVPGQRAVFLLNPADEPQEITVDFTQLGDDDGGAGGLADVGRMRDLGRREDIWGSLWQLTGRFSTIVPGRSLRVLKIWGTSFSC